MRRAAALGGIAALALAGCGAVPARQDAGREPPAPDRAALLAASCTGCHAPSQPGESVPLVPGTPSGAAGAGIPALGDASAAVIREALTAFRDGTRAGTVMPRLVRGYSDADIGLLSQHLGAP